MYPPRLWRKGESKSFKEREHVYILKENQEKRQCPNIRVILTMDIEELGLQGDVLSVRGLLARDYLIPSGAGVYASPENLLRYEPIIKANASRPRQPIEAQRTVRFLSAMTLPVPMNLQKQWTLDKRHIRISFRRVGIVVPEKNIALPPHSVTEPGDFTFEVTVNNIDSVKVKGQIVLYKEHCAALHNIKVFQDTTRQIENIVRETVTKPRSNSATSSKML